MNVRLLFASIATAAMASAVAGTKTYVAHLTGGEQVPPVVSAATGDVQFVVDTATFDYTLTGWAGTFATDLTGFHIHRGAVGTNGSVIINFGVGSFSSSTGGTILHTGTITDSVIGGVNVTAAEKLAYIDSGNAYVNTHTMANPGGEIRGQLTAVPEPSSLAAIGLGAVVLLRRRRKA